MGDAQTDSVDYLTLPPVGCQSIIAAGESRMQLPAYIRFFASPLAAPLHVNPFGAPESFPVACGETWGKNARTSGVAWWHGIPQEVTRYRVPRRGGAFGV